MARKLTKKGEIARARILRGAEKLFADKGFYGASIRDVALEVGIATASLLHHFSTKERLYGAVLERIAADLTAAMTSAVEGRGDHATRLRRLLKMFVGWAIEEAGRARLLLRELLDNTARLEGEPRLYLADLVERIAEFIRDGQRHHAFRDVDPELFVVHMAGSVSYYVVARPTLSRILDTPAGAMDRRYRRDVLARLQDALVHTGARQ